MKFKFGILFLLLVTVCQAQIQKRNYYKALLEPKKGVLHGAGQDSLGFLEYVAAVEKKQHPIIYMTYISLLNKDNLVNYGEHLTNLLQGLPGDVIPQIGLSFVAGNDNGAGQDKAVAEGLYDENYKTQLQNKIFIHSRNKNAQNRLK